MIVLEFSPWSAGQKTSADSDERLSAAFPVILPSFLSFSNLVFKCHLHTVCSFIHNFIVQVSQLFLFDCFFPFNTEHQAQILVQHRQALNQTQSHRLSMLGLVTYLVSMTRCLTESNLREEKFILMCSLRPRSSLWSERPGRSIQVILSSQWILKHRNESWNSLGCLFSPAVFTREP